MNCILYLYVIIISLPQLLLDIGLYVYLHVYFTKSSGKKSCSAEIGGEYYFLRLHDKDINTVILGITRSKFVPLNLCVNKTDSIKADLLAGSSLPVSI